MNPNATPENKKHSILGIISTLLALITGSIMLSLFIFSAYLDATTPGGVDEDSPAAILAGLGIFLTLAFIFLGTLFGFVGLFQNDKKKLFPAIGSFLNLFLLLGVIGVLILALLGNY